MDSNYVFLCGVMWCGYGQQEAGKELLRATSSLDPDIRALACALLAKGLNELRKKVLGRKRQGKHTIDRLNPQWVCRFHYDRWNADRARFLADRLGCQMEEL